MSEKPFSCISVVEDSIRNYQLVAVIDIAVLVYCHITSIFFNLFFSYICCEIIQGKLRVYQVEIPVNTIN